MLQFHRCNYIVSDFSGKTIINSLCKYQALLDIRIFCLIFGYMEGRGLVAINKKLTKLTIEEMCIARERQQCDCIYYEIQKARLPEPEYHEESIMLQITIKIKNWSM